MRSDKELINQAHERGFIEMTLSEAISFAQSTRNYTDAMSVQLVIKNYGGYSCTECEYYTDECTHWVALDDWEIDFLFDGNDNIEVESHWEFGLRSRTKNETDGTSEEAEAPATS